MENSPAPTEADVYEVLRECYDPEMPVNIVDLGLVYHVDVKGGVITVEMTLTAPGCSMGAMIASEIQDSCLASQAAKRPTSRWCGILHGRRT